MNAKRDIIAAQSDSLEPEEFQARIIAGMTKALLRDPSPPCLLRAPTGSGKTFVISRVLERVCATRPTLWFWFVPFVNLVQQTEDALAANCASLVPVMLARGRNQEPASGMVWLSTAQGVARAQLRKGDYANDGDDDVRSMADMVMRARAAGLSIGMVVDEAHIALDKLTEFGRFCQWLKPELLIMATATPNDQRLNEFIASAGYSNVESFTVARDEVVNARLNKRYIEAVIYDTRESVRTVADLKATVLRQGWLRSQKIKRALALKGIALTPLLLVQVANGEKAVDEAEEELVKLCKVPRAAIGKHSADEPDPVLMAAISADSSKEVLIFKQSAGTGFDAPRAFVLASTKPVNDPDFAMQFIGRVMRVAGPIRRAFPKPRPVLPEFDTAYVYLANAEAQKGFQSAVSATAQVKSQLEGQTEMLVQRETRSGAVVYTNRDSNQSPILYDLALPEADEPVPADKADQTTSNKAAGPQQSLFSAEEPPDSVELDEIDRAAQGAATAAKKVRRLPVTEFDLLETFSNRGVSTYRRRSDVSHLPMCLKREVRPELERMSAISRTAASRVEISVELMQTAVKAALGKLKEREIHTELTTGQRHDEEVRVLMDRRALTREAQMALLALPQVEDEDARIIIEVLSDRTLAAIKEAFDDTDEDARPDERGMQRFARDAAHWIARKQMEEIGEHIQAELSERSQLIEAGPLPDAFLFPTVLSLESSAKNIYGVLPPSEDELGRAQDVMMLDDREWMRDREWKLNSDIIFRVAQYDNSSRLNEQERAFAKALDRADFVAWWFRNPDRKPYSVALVRRDNKNYFYPDFVVCLEHVPGAVPSERLVETKEDVKDAQRKARHTPRHYGKVLFLTKDKSKFRTVEPEGLGEYVDFDDLSGMREWLRRNVPVA